jgi:hypothetical protein
LSCPATLASMCMALFNFESHYHILGCAAYPVAIRLLLPSRQI